MSFFTYTSGELGDIYRRVVTDAAGYQRDFFRWLYWNDEEWRQACDFAIEDLIRRGAEAPEVPLGRVVFDGRSVAMDFVLVEKVFEPMFRERWKLVTRKETQAWMKDLAPKDRRRPRRTRGLASRS